MATGLQHGFKRRIYVTRAKEATFGTIGAAALLTHSFNLLPGSGTLKIDPERFSDEELATNEEFQIDEYYGALTVPPTTLTTWASPEFIGIFGAFCLGEDTPGAVGTAEGHHIGMQPIGALAPGMDIEEHSHGADAVAASDDKYGGIVVQSFSMTGGRTGHVEASATVMGNGAEAAAVNESTMGVGGTLVTPSTYFLCPKTRISIQAAATEHETPWGGGTGSWADAGTYHATNALTTVLTDEIESWTYTVTNTFGYERAAGTAAGTGVYGPQPPVIKRTATLEMDLLYSANTNALIHAVGGGTAPGTTENNAEYGAIVEMVADKQIGVTTYYYGALARLPLCKIETTERDQPRDGLSKVSVRLVAKKDQSGNDEDATSMYTLDADAVAFCQNL